MDSNTFNRLQTIFPALNNEFEFVSSFTILWNIFESQLDFLGYQINYYGFKSFIEKGNLSNFVSAQYIDIWIEKGDYDFLNAHLKLDNARTNNPKPEYTALINNIKGVLDRTDNDTKEQNFVGLCISYRIRNNLFHGQKHVLDLMRQEDILNKVNNHLLQMIEYFHQNPAQLIPYSQ